VRKYSARWWRQWLKRQALSIGFGDTQLLVAMDREAKDAVAHFESDVRLFGYSLIDTDLFLRLPQDDCAAQSHNLPS
jgi:hypothetical protein